MILDDFKITSKGKEIIYSFFIINSIQVFVEWAMESQEKIDPS